MPDQTLCAAFMSSKWDAHYTCCLTVLLQSPLLQLHSEHEAAPGCAQTGLADITHNYFSHAAQNCQDQPSNTLLDSRRWHQRQQLSSFLQATSLADMPKMLDNCTYSRNSGCSAIRKPCPVKSVVENLKALNIGSAATQL
jgi:hypothetical protein